MLPFFQWCENSGLGNAIRGSSWLFPVIESIHLLALALIGGLVLVLNLRLLGFGLRSPAAAEIARETQPWLTGGLATMIVTGILLFLSESVKCYYSPAFWTKMTFLGPAIVFTYTAHRKVAMSDEGKVKPLWTRVTALTSVALWSVVGTAGRWIGFSG